MKKTVVFVLVLATLLTVSKMTYATTTLSLEKTIGASGTNYDYENNLSHKGQIDAFIINFTNITDIKKIKIDVDYHFGEFTYSIGDPSLALWDLQVGFPFIENQKGLVYFTLGAMKYGEYSQLDPKYEGNAALLGLDIVCTPTDKFQFAVNLQHSLGGSSKLFYSSVGIDDSSLDLTILKLKVQYILTENLGLAINYRLMDYNVNDPHVDAVDLGIKSMGFVYRF